MPRLYQGAFNSGEMAPGLWGRVDLDRFGAGLRVARNMFPLPEGGIMKRPGFEHISPVHYDEEPADVENYRAAARLVPFKFNNDQTYMVVLHAQLFWIIKKGAVVLNDMDAHGGTGTPTVAWTGSDDYQVSYTSHGYSDKDHIYWAAGGYDQFERRWMSVVYVDADTFNLYDPINTADAIGGGTDTYDSNGTTIDFGSPYTVLPADGWADDGTGSPPYADVPVADLDYTQANDTLYISHPSGPTKVITRTADAAWTCVNFDPSPGVSTPANVGTTTPGPPMGSKSIWYAVSAIDPETFEESIAAVYEVTSTDDPLGGNPITLTWDEQTSEEVEQYRIYRGVSGIYGLIGTASDPVPDTGGDTLTFEDQGYVPNLAIAPPLSADFFAAAGEYPGAVELFQQRIWFGRSDDLLRDIYASRSGSLASFATSTVSVDDDPIEQAIAAKSVQEVKHFVPLRDLVVLTSDGEWGFDTGDAGVLTPGAGLVAQSHWGTAGVKPVIIGESAIFVENSGKSIRDLAFALQSDGFASSDISIFAKHLFRGRTVVSMCFSQTPHRILFCVMSDGQAISCTYVRDQQIFAWARHETRGLMKDCATVQEDGIDNIYVVVERQNGDIHSGSWYTQIERMKMADPKFVEDGVWLDNSYQFNMPSFDIQFDWTILNSAVVQDAGVSKFRMALKKASTGGPPDDSLIRVNFEPGHSLESMNGMVFQVEDTLIAAGTGNWRELYRTINNSTTDRELFDPDGFVPRGFSDATDGYLTLQATDLKYGYHLNARGDQVSIRGDHMMYDDIEIDEGGEYTIAAAAGLIHAGELYRAEIETLDIDSIQDPITGSSLTLSNVLTRLSIGVQYSFGRRRADLTDVTLAMLYAEEDWNAELGHFQGVYDGLPFPGWKRDGRMILRSEDGYPFIIAALVPLVESGDIDV